MAKTTNKNGDNMKIFIAFCLVLTSTISFAENCEKMNAIVEGSYNTTESEFRVSSGKRKFKDFGTGEVTRTGEKSFKLLNKKGENEYTLHFELRDEEGTCKVVFIDQDSPDKTEYSFDSMIMSADHFILVNKNEASVHFFDRKQ